MPHLFTFKHQWETSKTGYVFYRSLCHAHARPHVGTNVNTRTSIGPMYGGLHTYARSQIHTRARALFVSLNGNTRAPVQPCKTARVHARKNTARCHAYTFIYFKYILMQSQNLTRKSNELIQKNPNIKYV